MFGIASGLVIACVAIFGYFQVGVPVLRIHESCDLSWPRSGASVPEALERTHARLERFFERVNAFASQHDGRMAYLDIQIRASNSARGCAIAKGELGHFVEDASVQPPFSIAATQDSWSEPFFFDLVGPNGGSGQISIPVNQRELPRNGQYQAIRHGYVLSVKGPFFVEHQEGNGFGQITFHPQTERVLSEAEISCARRKLAYPRWIRGLAPCF